MARTRVQSPTSFNPRAREERDGCQDYQPPRALSFNPRAREERDIDTYVDGIALGGFNPRAREERDWRYA